MARTHVFQPAHLTDLAYIPYLRCIVRSERLWLKINEYQISCFVCTVKTRRMYFVIWSHALFSLRIIVFCCVFFRSLVDSFHFVCTVDSLAHVHALFPPCGGKWMRASEPASMGEWDARWRRTETNGTFVFMHAHYLYSCTCMRVRC